MFSRAPRSLPRNHDESPLRENAILISAVNEINAPASNGVFARDRVRCLNCSQGDVSIIRRCIDDSDTNALLTGEI